MKSGCQFTVSYDVCCICVCIPYHHHPAPPSASPEVVGRHNKYVNFVCHKLQKTSDMALGNETTNRDGEKKNKVNVYTLGTWQSHGMQHKNTLIGLCTLIHIRHPSECMMECSAHFGKFCLHDKMIQTHELNIENMQMPQVLSNS